MEEKISFISTTSLSTDMVPRGARESLEDEVISALTLVKEALGKPSIMFKKAS